MKANADIIDLDYTHAKTVCKDFKINNLGEYYDLCSKQHIIVSWCFWELLKHISWDIWTRPFSFSYCSSISMESSLKKDQSKLNLLTNIKMLLMI